MKAFKKGIALIMLTLVMLVGSVAQTFAASAQTVQRIELQGVPTPIDIRPTPFPSFWRVENKAPFPNKGFIDFLNGEPRVELSLRPNESTQGIISSPTKRAFARTDAPATLTIIPGR